MAKRLLDHHDRLEFDSHGKLLNCYEYNCRYNKFSKPDEPNTTALAYPEVGTWLQDLVNSVHVVAVVKGWALFGTIESDFTAFFVSPTYLVTARHSVTMYIGSEIIIPQSIQILDQSYSTCMMRRVCGFFLITLC